MSPLSVILVLILILLLVGGLPAIGFHHYGYGPSGIIGLILVVVLILIVLGRL